MITRALIVKKEWLELILNGEKTWEMRSTKTNITGRIGLIEAGSGLIMGEATLKGCGLELDELISSRTYRRHRVANPKLLAKWKYPWILGDAKRYSEPIPYTHPQGAVIWVKL